MGCFYSQLQLVHVIKSLTLIGVIRKTHSSVYNFLLFEKWNPHDQNNHCRMF